MDNIVKRLRLWQHGKYTIDPPYADKAIFYESDCGEAADEIERLQAGWESVLRREEEQNEQIQGLRAERDALKEAIDTEAMLTEAVSPMSDTRSATTVIREVISYHQRLDRAERDALKLAVEQNLRVQSIQAGALRRLHAERDALRKDAERYRLVSRLELGVEGFAICEWLNTGGWFRTGRLMPQEIDATLDAALAKGK